MERLIARTWLLLALLPMACRSPDAYRMLVKPSPEVLYSVETSEPVVALTIDDGPDPAETRRILEVLEAHGATATFFLISDKVEGHEELVREIVEAGHEIANHLTRDEPAIDLAPADFESELGRAHRVLSRYQEPTWFRPGSGWYDEWMFPALERHDYRLALGNAYPLDAAIPSVWLASHWLLWQTQPGDVIILHDGQGRGFRTARTLDRVLPELQRRGMRVVSLSELAQSAEVARDAH